MKSDKIPDGKFDHGTFTVPVRIFQAFTGEFKVRSNYYPRKERGKRGGLYLPWKQCYLGLQMRKDLLRVTIYKKSDRKPLAATIYRQQTPGRFAILACTDGGARLGQSHTLAGMAKEWTEKLMEQLLVSPQS